MPNGDIKYAYRVSRFVILPDYQGLGIGGKFLQFVAQHYFSQGKKLYIRTTHLKLVGYLRNSKIWKESSASGTVSCGGKGKATKIKQGYKDQQLNRIAYSFQYMGENYGIKEHRDLLIDGNKLDYELLEEDLIYLSKKFWLNVITGEINSTNKVEEICLKHGIYTSLLYRTRQKISSINKKYQSKKINKTWNEQKHQYVLSHY